MPLSKHFRFCLWWESFFNGGHFSSCQTRKKSTPVTFFQHMRHIFLRSGVISLRRKMTPRSIFDGGRYSSLYRLIWSLFLRFLTFLAIVPIMTPRTFSPGHLSILVFMVPFRSRPDPHLSLNVVSTKTVFCLAALSFPLNSETCTHLFSMISAITSFSVVTHCSFGLTLSPSRFADSASGASLILFADSRSPHRKDFMYWYACSADLWDTPYMTSSQG